jgi:predicted DNA-binding protein (MmcQ/YjbR family)
MVRFKDAQMLALAFEWVTESPHHDVAVRAFKVKGKVFATLNEKEERMTVRLSILDQDVFCTFDNTVIYPVPNKWGTQGWTHVNLKKVRKEMLQDILSVAYCTVAPKKLAEKYRIE